MCYNCFIEDKEEEIMKNKIFIGNKLKKMIVTLMQFIVTLAIMFLFTCIYTIIKYYV